MPHIVSFTLGPFLLMGPGPGVATLVCCAQRTKRNEEVIMEFFDKTLTCRECTKEFLFTAGEQEFYMQKGLLNEPGRCPECRIRRRVEAMASASGQAQAEEVPVQEPVATVVSSVKEVSEILCAECGKKTTVPFKPRLLKPVYCKSCFDKQKLMAALAATTSGVATTATSPETETKPE
jgi:CxxC-x17-CxxC domain-containing protein